MTLRRHSLAALASAILCTGCVSEHPASPVTAPRVTLPLVLPNPNNALSAAVTFEAQNADSVRVLYWIPGAARFATPFYPVTAGPERSTTLGLRPNTAYYHLVEARAGERVGFSDSI